MPVLLPTTLSAAVEMLSHHEDALLLSGGTDAMVQVNFNHLKPSTVIGLRNIPELHHFEIDDQKASVFIGAGVPYREMEKGPLADKVPALAQAARTVGSPQIRSAGTLGGNLGTCSPAGDSLPVLSALDAVIHLVSLSGTRTVSVHEFMVGPKKNARQPGEIISGVTLPTCNGRQGYAKVGVRNAMVISVASACFAIQDDTVRLALGSVGPTVIRCLKAESFLQDVISGGKPITVEIAHEFGKIASSESRPIDDHRSSADYRRHAVSVLAQRLALRGQ